MMMRRSIGVRHNDAHQSHFSFGNRTGLINANHGGAAQSLGGQKISHQAMVMKKPLHSDSQYGGHGYDETLVNGRYGQRYRGLKHIKNFPPGNPAKGENQ